MKLKWLYIDAQLLNKQKRPAYYCNNTQSAKVTCYVVYSYGRTLVRS